MTNTTVPIAEDHTAIARRMAEITRAPTDCPHCAYVRSFTPPMPMCEACAAK